MDAITEACDGDVQMIDSSSVRVHQHAGCAKKGVEFVVWAVAAGSCSCLQAGGRAGRVLGLLLPRPARSCCAHVP